MNDRQRVLTLLSGGVPDRVPWFGDLAYWALAVEQRGEVPQDWQRTEDYYQLHRQLGVGFYLQGYWAFREVTDPSVVIETRDRAHLNDVMEALDEAGLTVEHHTNPGGSH